MATAAPTTSAAAFTLPPLPYAASALEPVIDTKTMETHHGKHHQAYVDNLNKAVSETAAAQGKTLEALMPIMSSLNAAIRNNGGGHWNHMFFWESMAPVGQGGQPSPELMAAITQAFGDMDKFQAAFNDAGVKRFGSGWAWLIARADGTLAITSTPNQDNPLMDLAEVKGAPLLGNDVWEHAYYLQYQNRRADYLKAWWQVVNWNKVNERFAALRK